MHSSPARHHVVLWLAMLAFGPPVDANAHRLSVLNPARIAGTRRYRSRYLEDDRPKRPQAAHNDGRTTRDRPREVLSNRHSALGDC